MAFLAKVHAAASRELERATGANGSLGVATEAVRTRVLGIDNRPTPPATTIPTRAVKRAPVVNIPGGGTKTTDLRPNVFLIGPKPIVDVPAPPMGDGGLGDARVSGSRTDPVIEVDTADAGGLTTVGGAVDVEPVTLSMCGFKGGKCSTHIAGLNGENMGGAPNGGAAAPGLAFQELAKHPLVWVLAGVAALWLLSR